MAVAHNRPLPKKAAPSETNYDYIAFFSDRHAAELLRNNKNDILFGVHRVGTVVPVTCWMRNKANARLYRHEYDVPYIGAEMGFFGKINVGTLKQIGCDSPQKIRDLADTMQDILARPDGKPYHHAYGMNDMKRDRFGPFAALKKT